MQPYIIELDIHKLVKQNIIWTITLSILFLIINITLQPQHFDFSIGSSILSIFYFSIAYLVLIVLHEACHLIGFVIFGRAPFSSLSYGVDLQKGLAYATTTERISNSGMKKALLLPFWITGVIPTLIGFYVNSNLIILVGAFLIAGAVGDFTMYKELRKFPKDASIEDDPKEPKLYVYVD
ncbi:MAG: DUF3267 domain-containing protein [Lysinibacillus sp.]